MRSMVEGYCARDRSRDGKDMLNYAFEIGECVSRGNAKNLDTLRRQPNIPILVMLRSIRTAVRFPIDLNC